MERGDELVETVLARVRFPEEDSTRRIATFAARGRSRSSADRIRSETRASAVAGSAASAAAAAAAVLSRSAVSSSSRSRTASMAARTAQTRAARTGRGGSVGVVSALGVESGRRLVRVEGVVAATEGERDSPRWEMRLGPVWSRGDARVGGVEGVRGETPRGGARRNDCCAPRRVASGDDPRRRPRRVGREWRGTRGGLPRARNTRRRAARRRIGTPPPPAATPWPRSTCRARTARRGRGGERRRRLGNVRSRRARSRAASRSSARNTSSSVMDSEKWSASAPFRRCQPYIAPSRGVVWRPRDAVANVVTPPGRRFDSPKQESPNAAMARDVPKTTGARPRHNVASTTRADLTNAGARGARDVTPRRARSTEISLAAVPSTVPGPSPRARRVAALAAERSGDPLPRRRSSRRGRVRQTSRASGVRALLGAVPTDGVPIVRTRDRPSRRRECRGRGRGRGRRPRLLPRGRPRLPPSRRPLLIGAPPTVPGHHPPRRAAALRTPPANYSSSFAVHDVIVRATDVPPHHRRRDERGQRPRRAVRPA